MVLLNTTDSESFVTSLNTCTYLRFGKRLRIYSIPEKLQKCAERYLLKNFEERYGAMNLSVHCKRKGCLKRLEAKFNKHLKIDEVSTCTNFMERTKGISNAAMWRKKES